MVSHTVVLKKRYEILDIVRGFAMLGVLLMHMRFHSLYSLLEPAEKAALPLSMFNQPLEFMTIMLIDSKFYTIFSTLFGLGFSLIIIKQSGNHIIFRRLFVLMLIGLAHTILFWQSDILLPYAVFGFCLIFLNRYKDKTILALAIFLMASPTLSDGIKDYTDVDISPETILYGLYSRATVLETKYLGEPIENNRVAIDYQNSYGFIDRIPVTIASTLREYAWNIEEGRAPKILGLFLLGLLIGRHKLYEKLDVYSDTLRKIRNIGFLIGLPTSIIYTYITMNDFIPLYEHGELYNSNVSNMLRSAMNLISVSALAAAYVATICLFYINGNFTKILHAFGYVGKMALTVYLSQTIAAVIVFTGVGFGLMAQFSMVELTFMGLAFFALQMFLCKWWLTWFEFGPFEWIWRQLTYGKRMPIRKTTTSAETS